MKNVYKKDGLMKLIENGVSRVREKKRANLFENTEEIELLDGYLNRVISCVAEDMTKKGFSITGDNENILNKELSKLNILGTLYQAIYYCQLYGSVAILLGANDGNTYENELKINKVSSLDFLRIYPISNVSPVTESLNTDVTSPDYGTYNNYRISDTISLSPYVVHKSRLLIIKWINNLGIEKDFKSSKSVVDYIVPQITNLNIFQNALAELSKESSVNKYKIAHLSDLLSSDNEDKILNRLDNMSVSRNRLNAVFLDATNDEDYSRDNLTFSGINGVADTFMVMLSAVTGIPVTRLFGRSPSGLDASGESDLKIYYDKIMSHQETLLTNIIQHIVHIINSYKKVIVTDTSTYSDYVVVWNNLNVPSEKDKATTFFTNAQADTSYILNGVLSVDEVRESRFVNGYNDRITVKGAAPKIENPVKEPIETLLEE